MNEKEFEKYASLVLQVGVNLQKGQMVFANCPAEKAEVAEIFARRAYELGAGYVKILFNDEKLDRLAYEHAEERILCDVFPSAVLAKEEIVQKGACYVSLIAEDPDALAGLNETKLANVSRARAKAFKNFQDAVMVNKIRWCVAAIPGKAWAKKLFPDAKDPEEELWNAIAAAVRLQEADPVSAWRAHIGKLNARAEFLNERDFSALHFVSENGTDLTVGLADGHFWLAAEETARDGVKFIANLPTEEVFTAPHSRKVDGVVKNALPLVYDGSVIDDFSLTFEAGQIVSFSAKRGEGTLRGVLSTDEGAKRVGEVALIGKNSPIAKAGMLFYNTLFDENASCHLALGQAYPTTLRGGGELTKDELAKRGANDSATHVDFMIGTPDLSVTGIGKDGSETPVMKNGDWVI